MTNIITKELSLVKRGANRRPWLVVKQEAGMPRELQEDGQGGFTSVTEPPASPAPQQPAQEQPPPAEVVAEKVKTTKAAGDAVSAAIANLTSLSARLDCSVDQASSEYHDEVVKALSQLVPEQPEQPSLAVSVAKGLTEKQPEVVAKGLTGAAAKLLEIAQSLQVELTPSDDEWPWSLRYKIEQVLSALVVLADLETAHPEAAKLVASTVTKADDSETKRFQAVSKSLHNVLASASGVRHDTGVKSNDEAATVDLIEKASAEIKRLRTQVAKLESRAEPSLALTIEDAPESRAAADLPWPSDMAADLRE